MLDCRGFRRLTAAESRVIRGGNWNNNSNNLQSSNRNNNSPGNENNNIGFRVAGSRIEIPPKRVTLAELMFTVRTVVDKCLYGSAALWNHR
ncbi:SUMF1/EgtB/PvdO family nonheme iron enzyme [Rubritalea profundi]|uniref:SUMF1/EgtB/PvdO family nonheme iron enzyme n=1 Tax=Rubritalea profundi TaxID=1658618 RepID=UPI00101AEC71